MRITIDVDALRDYMEDYYGTAAFSGMPFAMMDVINVSSMSDEELVQLAQREGVDLRRFEWK